MFGFFSSRCDICDNAIRRIRYKWEIRGKNAWVCPTCNSKLERRKSKYAFDPKADLKLPEVRSRSIGCGGWFLLLIGLGAVLTILRPSTHTSTSTSVASSSNEISAISPAPTITVIGAQKEAVRRFPELGIAGSKLNSAFIARYKFYQQQRPDYFHDAAWPIHLAEEVASNPPPN